MLVCVCARTLVVSSQKIEECFVSMFLAAPGYGGFVLLEERKRERLSR